MKPRIAIVYGDPAGIGPELVAKLLAVPANLEKADILLIADRDELDEGMRIAGTRFDVDVVDDRARVVAKARIPALWSCPTSARGPFRRASATAESGRYSIDSLSHAMTLTAGGVTDAICFAPLNKYAMHQAGLGHPDESEWFADVLHARGPSGELNVLDGLWTSRVTSHVALKDVSALITVERIVDAIRLLHDSVRNAGVAEPRIAVCGLNPHNGDNGSFGREEIDVIGPAIEQARALGYPATGPYPADTIFLRAKEVDAIVTMYHDQGQIAMKLMGFSRGVTVHGGLPIPITTPAHGTAFDIYGQGKADPRAMQAAFDLACRMARGRRERIGSGAAQRSGTR